MAHFRQSNNLKSPLRLLVALKFIVRIKVFIIFVVILVHLWHIAEVKNSLNIKTENKTKLRPPPCTQVSAHYKSQ